MFRASAAEAAPPAGTDRIAIPVDDRLTVVRVAEIDWVEALGNYVSLRSAAAIVSRWIS
jgi:DNA-binding LytR/AlgR family response regulator